MNSNGSAHVIITLCGLQSITIQCMVMPNEQALIGASADWGCSGCSMHELKGVLTCMISFASSLRGPPLCQGFNLDNLHEVAW